MRLWLVLFPALAVGFLWDRLSLLIRAPSPSYSGAVFDHFFPPGTLLPTLTLPVLIGNAVFVQGILVHTIGTNSALWSLSNEFWYYLLFPLALFAIRGHYKSITRVIFGISFIVVALFVGKVIMFMFPFWLVGMLPIILARRNFSFPMRAPATGAYAGLFLGSVAASHSHGWLAEYVLALGTTAYIWALLAGTQRSANGRSEHLARGLARFSYTLYLVHMPLMYFLTSFLVHDQWWMPTIPRLLIALILLILIICYEWLVASATEFRIVPIRRLVESKLERLPSHYLRTTSCELSDRQ